MVDISATIFLYKGSIQKEVIFDMKDENQFWTKEIWESICLIYGERSANRFIIWILRQSLSGYGANLRMAKVSIFFLPLTLHGDMGLAMPLL
jgi:hypothetical protein